MSESGSSPADRLVSACFLGDVPSAKAAVADGAIVNAKGTTPFGVTQLPLSAAVFKARYDVVVWLLSVGADPNGDLVMWYGTRNGVPAILQLLIDAGGDVNRKCGGSRPLERAVQRDIGDTLVPLLLAEPSLDCARAFGVRPLEVAVRAVAIPALADAIVHEVTQRVWDVVFILLLRRGGGEQRLRCVLAILTADVRCCAWTEC